MGGFSTPAHSQTTHLRWPASENLHRSGPQQSDRDGRCWREAEEAKRLGVVSELVPREKLMERARELAAQLVKLPPLTTSYARVALMQKFRRIVDESVSYGLALEGLSAADVARMNH